MRLVCKIISVCISALTHYNFVSSHHRVILDLLVLLVLLVKTGLRVLVVMAAYREDRETLGFVDPLAYKERRESLERMAHL